MNVTFMRGMAIPIDFAMCVFLWIVQMIIYPSFRYIKRSDFQNWHSRYMKTIGLLMGPIMTIQIVLISYAAYNELDRLNLLRLLLLIMCWLLTLVFSIPMHRNLEQAVSIEESIEQLIRSNWFRTLLWMLIFLSNFLPS